METTFTVLSETDPTGDLAFHGFVTQFEYVKVGEDSHLKPQ